MKETTKENLYLLKKLVRKIPFVPAYLITALVLALVFGYGTIGKEIGDSLTAGLNTPLVTVSRETAASTVARVPAAQKTPAPQTTAPSAPEDSSAADNGENTASSVPAADGTTAVRGSSDYSYDPASATGDPDTDLILQTENAPEVYADSLDEFGNVLPGASAPDGTFTYVPETGVNTAFLSYEAVPTNNHYFNDPGQYTFTTAADYVTVDDSYFSDALFIGDSRTLGLSDYGTLPADFFCNSGYSTKAFVKGEKAVLQRTGASMTLQEVLAAKSYGKVYIILGMNDSGYGTTDDFTVRYQQLIAAVREKNPTATLYLCANMYLARTYADKLGVMNNTAVKDKNCAIARLADGQTSFYLNYNGMFTDSEMYLRPSLTQDGAHLYGRHYALWRDYFRHHAVKGR